MDFKSNLIQNVHHGIPLLSKNNQSVYIRGDYSYYHYKCDEVNDVGWGCGYRTLQTMCSQIKTRRHLNSTTIPTIHDIQSILIQIGDKETNFLNSRDWIGSVEISYIIDHLFDTPCRILHIGPNKSLKDYTEVIKTYLVQYGGIIMMGGEMDNASKGICGLHIGQNIDDIFFLIIDPHFDGVAKSSQQLQQLGYVKWQHINEFNNADYFYNLCMPLISE